MPEVGEIPQQVTQETTQSTEDQKSLRDKTKDFFQKHKFATTAALTQMVSTQVYLGSKSLQDVLVNGLIGIGSGLLIGGFIDHNENKSKREREARQERYSKTSQRRRKLSTPKNNK